MSVRTPDSVTLERKDILTIRHYILILVKVYYHIATKHMTLENEEDLEDFAKLMAAFSFCIGDFIRYRAEGKSIDDDGVPDAVVDFYMSSSGLLKK